MHRSLCVSLSATRVEEEAIAKERRERIGEKKVCADKTCSRELIAKITKQIERPLKTYKQNAKIRKIVIININTNINVNDTFF